MLVLRYFCLVQNMTHYVRHVLVLRYYMCAIQETIHYTSGLARLLDGSRLIIVSALVKGVPQ